MYDWNADDYDPFYIDYEGDGVNGRTICINLEEEYLHQQNKEIAENELL